MNTKPYILVTGATGGLGRNLVEYLLSVGNHVVAIGRNQNIGKQLQFQGATFISTDIRNEIHIEKSLGTCLAIIHCAALSKPWGKYLDFYITNVVGTKNVIELAYKKDCPLIHISTPSVYFDFRDRLNISENDPLSNQFASFYTETKKLAEDLVIGASNMIKSVILRPRGIFGPYDKEFIPRVSRIASRGYFPLIRNGDPIVDITYVENVVDAIMLSLSNIETVSGQIFNITNNQPLKIQNILDILFDALKVKVRLIKVKYSLLKSVTAIMELTSKLTNYAFEPPITSYTLGLLSYSQTLNIHNAQTLLKFKPSVSIEEGINRFAKWFSHG
ncbi:MAG: SDR family NAD(P)-dependent oxidoreductase [Wolbachia endosymbiont of Tyrophagus putrescentiae]|nr:SDR family NAD(P)-dependent oxidoreductase [Wolbachia endosymbiont of Tyrophagus putrescentiae]